MAEISDKLLDRLLKDAHIWRDSKMLALWMGGRQLDLMEIARYFYECETL